MLPGIKWGLKMQMQTRYNTYFKGGAEDKFMSGLWIGDAQQECVMFISCKFNGVHATFKNCVFVDCDNPPDGVGCIELNLPYNKRITVQTNVAPTKMERAVWE